MATVGAGTATARLRAARDFLLNHREDYATAYRDYRQPVLEEFNWALDWFDAIAADGGDRPALRIFEPDGGETRRTFAELSARSNQVANWFREHGVARGDRVIVMLGNQVELWETILAAMKLGAVIIPATPLLGPADLVDHVERGDARQVVVPSAHATKFDDVPGAYTRIAVGESVDGWLSYADSGGSDTSFAPTRETALDIMRFARQQLTSYKRVRRLEFAELPKTISGKIRRVELRTAEHERLAAGEPPPERAPGEFWEEDSPQLRR